MKTAFLILASVLVLNLAHADETTTVKGKKAAKLVTLLKQAGAPATNCAKGICDITANLTVESNKIYDEIDHPIGLEYSGALITGTTEMAQVIPAALAEKLLRALQDTNAHSEGGTSTYGFYLQVSCSAASASCELTSTL